MDNIFSKIILDSEEAMSIKYNTMVYELQRMGKKVTILSLGEAFFDIPLFSFDNLPFPLMYHYTNSRGIPELRQKLSEYFLSHYDIPINYEKEILITTGSKAAIHFAFMATLNPGDEVIIPEPYWVSYPEQVKLCYAQPVCLPYYKSILDIEEYITDKTKVIVINNPHNPTGYVYTELEIKHLLAIAEKYNLWIFSDEAYSEFTDNNTFISPAKFDRLKKHTVVFNSISKNYGISGWRLGYVIANEQLIYNILKINQHIITCPATVLEFYVEKYFYDILEITKPQITKLIKKRKAIEEYIHTIGLQTLNGSATFYFFLSISPSRLSSEEFCSKLLHEYYISTVPGLGYGESCNKFIRISIGTATIDEIKESLIVIKTLIDVTSNTIVTNKTNILVVAGGLWQIPLITYLKNQGHFVYVVDPYLHSPGVKLADKHIQCDVRDYDSIVAQVKDTKFEFIATDQSDLSINTVAKLNSFFGLPGNTIKITELFVNKYLMRQQAEKVGVPIPKFEKISSTNELQQFINKSGLPIIIKPADSQSSRGVVKIDTTNESQLEHFVVSSLKYSNCGYLIAEEFVEGNEVTVEGIASNFQHRTLAISLKKHFRTGIASELRYPAAIPQAMYDELERINDLYVEKSGLRFGITHAEYMINVKTGKIVLIEIACRGGGTLISSDIVNWVSGNSVYDMYYNNLKGGILNVKALNVQKRSAILKFFEFNPGVVKAIHGIEEVKMMKEIKHFNLSFKAGDTLQPAEDDRSRQGFFIAFAENENKLNEVISLVNSKIVIDYK